MVSLLLLGICQGDASAIPQLGGFGDYGDGFGGFGENIDKNINENIEKTVDGFGGAVERINQRFNENIEENIGGYGRV